MSTPATKQEPVRMLGAVITGATAITGGLVVVLHDSPQAILILGIVGVIVAGVNLAKDSYVRGVVIPAADVALYVNDDRQTVAGPAIAVADALPVLENGSEIAPAALDLHDGVSGPHHAAEGRGVAGSPALNHPNDIDDHL